MVPGDVHGDAGETPARDRGAQEEEEVDEGAELAGGEPLKHLVVDAGAIIRLENLNGKAEEFWTVREVIAEIRDKHARRALETLPFELKVREPSDEALAAVVAFAKKSGDLAVLSKPDIRIMALAYMLHKETHGTQDLRTAPIRPGTSAADAASDSHAPAAGDEVDSEPSPSPSDNAAVANLRRTNNKVIPLKSNNVAKPGVSWAAALGPKKGEAPSATADTTSDATPAPASGAPLDPASMWDDDDFAGLEDDSDELESRRGVLPNGGAKSSPAASAAANEEEAWPSLEAARDAAAAEQYVQSRDETEAQLREIEAKEKRKVEKRLKKQEKKLEELRKEQETRAASEKNGAEETAPTAHVPDHLQGGSRILGISGVVVDSGELEGEGWVTPQNVSFLDPADAMKTLTLQGTARQDKPEAAAAAQRKPIEAHRVACITSDYAMQNVMLQMGLRLMTMEGRAVTFIRRFVLKCDSCGAICKKLDKKFCPSCGNATLARLNYSIGPDGVLSYHFKKNRQINTRGMRYSMPKPKGGRRGDLLLAEDQLLTGYWSQHAHNKSTSTSMFGEHVTESLGLKLSGQADDGLRIGYGRQNPNAAKGRERRGKKKKRSEKRPGFL